MTLIVLFLYVSRTIDPYESRSMLWSTLTFWRPLIPTAHPNSDMTLCVTNYRSICVTNYVMQHTHFSAPFDAQRWACGKSYESCSFKNCVYTNMYIYIYIDVHVYIWGTYKSLQEITRVVLLQKLCMCICKYVYVNIYKCTCVDMRRT